MQSIAATISWCARLSPARISGSGTCFAPPSTITSAPRLPATTRSMSHSALSSGVGLTIQRSAIRPRRTAAIGPRNGISEIASAADAPMNAGMSGVF